MIIISVFWIFRRIIVVSSKCTQFTIGILISSEDGVSDRTWEK